MLSSSFIKLMEVLPKPLVMKLAKMKVNGYMRKYAKINVKGLENIDKISGPKIFVCNHLSNSDGLVLNEVLKRYDPTFVAGVKLSNNPITSIGSMVVKKISINPNTVDKDAIIKMVDILKSGNNLMIFPEGTRSRQGKMLEGKKGVLLVVKMSKATIIPISMWGTEKLLPVNKDDNMATEEWNFSDVNVVINKAVEIPKKEKNELKHDYDDRCMNIIMKSIANSLPNKYRGVYE